jgi:prevent-host-death family protein
MAILLAIGVDMRFASVAEVKNQLSAYLKRARKKKEPIVVTHHGKPYALIQPLTERDVEELAWKQLATRRLQRAWECESDALYDYL